MSRHFSPQKLSYIIASHADPDIIASLDRWLTSTPAQLVISRVWERFVPHFTKTGKTDQRVIGVADGGGRLPLGEGELWLLACPLLALGRQLPFLRSRQPHSFTGDLGVSMTSGRDAQVPVTDLNAGHLRLMEGFHRRYMVSNKVLSLWVRMARQLDIRMLVPQHGAPLTGGLAIGQFFDWAESLMCGIDLFDDKHYQAPIAAIPLPARA